jgi:L-seryl-tRNA(Ser) seleniumtransferase
LIQIGGGFRIPEILESSGARLREVGTTNKTSLHDYAQAMTSETAMILKVHRSNFYMDGFVESPPTEEIVRLAGRKRVPFVEDLGSGAVIDTQTILGLEHEPTPAEVIRRGVDLVCFSGDKLLGGPQAGIIAGNAQRIAALKREPLFRALRCDKLILSALETTVDIHLRNSYRGASNSTSASGKRVESNSLANHPDVPVIEMLRVSIDELRSRAKNIVSALDGLPITATIGVGRAQVGGGTLPRSMLDSITLDLTHSKLGPRDIAARLREHLVPIIGYTARGKFKLDLRTVFPPQDAELIKAIHALCA